MSRSPFSRHPERSEGSLYFAVAVAFVFAVAFALPTATKDRVPVHRGLIAMGGNVNLSQPLHRFAFIGAFRTHLQL
jgi:hypothetical protein